jgi:hypothetical protein
MMTPSGGVRFHKDWFHFVESEILIYGNISRSFRLSCVLSIPRPQIQSAEFYRTFFPIPPESEEMKQRNQLVRE